MALESILALSYVALLPFSWPALPLNTRVVDLFVVPLALLLLRGGHLQRTFRRLTPLDWCVLALVIVPLPSVLATEDLRVSGVALAKRLYVVGVFGVFAAYFERFGVRPAIRVLVRAAIAICVVSLLAALAYVGGWQTRFAGQPISMPYVGPVLRLSGGTETPGMFANYLTVVWPLACLVAWTSVRRGLWVAGLVVMALAMALTFSHAVAGLAAATVAVTWACSSTDAWRRTRIVLALATAILIVGVNVLLSVTVRDLTVVRDHHPGLPKADYHYVLESAEGPARVTASISYDPMSYYLLKQVAVDAFREHPLTGIGLGTFHLATARAYDAGRLQFAFSRADPHSTIFGALAETGLLGLIAPLALFAAALVRSPRSQESVWLVRALKAALVGLAINSVNTDVLNFRFLWITLAALRALA